MANTKAYTSVGKPSISGAIWRADTSATIPTDAATALSSDYVCMGYVSSDGLVNQNTKESTDVVAWGGDTILSPVTSYTDKFVFTLVESLNVDVLTMIHGDDNVSGTLAAGISIEANSDSDTEHVYVVDMELNNDVLKRIVIPCGVVSAVGDVTYKDDTAIGYPVTLTALPDDSSNTHYEYLITSTD